MGIADFFRPKHRHSDSRVRAEAVRALTADDTDVLLQVARTDRDVSVRRLAIERVTTPDALVDLRANETDASLRDLAGERAAALWLTTACSDDDDAAGEALAGLMRLGDQRALVDVAARGHGATRKRALAEIREPKALAELARTATQPEVRLEAVARLDEPEVLRALATDTSNREVGLAALDKLDDPEMLETVAQKAKHKAVRLRARKVVSEMAAAEKARVAAANASSNGITDEQKRRRAEKAQLMREVEAVALDMHAGAAVRAAETRFAALGGHDDIDSKFATLIKKYGQRKEAFDRQAALTVAGSEAQQARRREDDARRAAQQAERDAQAHAAADEAAAPQDEAAIAARAAQQAEAAARRVDADARRVAQDAERAGRDAERSKRSAELVARFTTGLEQLATMGAEATLATIEFRVLDRVLVQAHADADAVTRIGTPEGAALIERFDVVRLPLVKRAQELRDAEEWQRYANVPRAEQLVRAAEELATTDVDDVGGVLKMLQGMWKDMGPLPPKKSKELWDKFKAFGDQAYEKVKVQRDANAAKYADVAAVKERLIAAAEALASSSDWDATAAQLKTLQAEWKLSGALPRRQADELWNRFRTACDGFFQRRAPQLEAQFAEQQDNLVRKDAIVSRIEALASAATPDGGWGQAIGEVKRLQLQWRDIGFVPRRDADGSYARLRAAGDAFFARLDASKGEEATARRGEFEAARTELTALLATTAGGDDGAATVTKALAARDRVRDLTAQAGAGDELVTLLGQVLRHVALTQPDAVRGTELDLAAADARLRKLIARADELTPKDAPVTAPAATAEALADRLKHAMAQNAFGGLRFSGRDPIEVVAELRAEWREVAALAPEAANSRRAAFDEACACALGAGRDEPAAAPVATAPAPVAVVAPMPVVAPVVAAIIGEAAPRARSITTQPPLDALDTAWDLDDQDAAAPLAQAAAPKVEGTSMPGSAEMAGDGATEGDGGIDSGWD